MKYRRMDWNDRVRIEALYNAGHTYRFIAQQTGFSLSSVHREVHRGLYLHRLNSKGNSALRYSAQIAHDDAVYQATSKGRMIKLGKNHAYANHVAQRIKKGESPDSIVGSLRRKGKWTVSTPTLYRYIDAGYIPGVTNKNLLEKTSRKRRSDKPDIKPKKDPHGLSIELRPQEVADRKIFGHWEMDSLCGKVVGKRESFVVLTERMTRYEVVCRVEDKTTASTVAALDQLFARFPRGTFKSITVDNGSEFRDTYNMEHSKYGNKRTTVYYCHPFTSCERGSNERVNRQLRRFFPKRQSLKDYRQKDCDKAAYILNNLPRRILGYATPAELFIEEIIKLKNNSL